MTPNPPMSGNPHSAAVNNSLRNVGLLLAISGGLSLALAVISTLLNLSGANESALNDPQLQAQLANNPALKMLAGGGSKIISAVWGLLMMAANGLIIFGGLKMRSAQSYALSMTAAVLSMVPCCFNSCCTIISLPLGIAALVVLLNPDNKAAFTR